MATLNRPLIQSLVLASICLLTVPAASVALDHITVRDSRNNEYLPFGLDTISNDQLPIDRPQIRHPIQVYISGKGDTAGGLYATACNPAPKAEPTSDLSVRTCGHKDYFLESAIKFTMYDFGLYHSLKSATPGILAGGYRHDSSFVARVLHNDSGAFYIPLSHGVDVDGNNEWRGSPGFVTALDYDHDGREEAFFWVDAIRDKIPRDLVCIDPDSAIIKWKIPVAPAVVAGQLFSIGDSLDPQLIFSAYGMGQNVEDSLFSSNYGYVAIVDHTGRVVQRKIAGKFSDEVRLVQLPGNSHFLLIHALPLIDSQSEADSLKSNHFLSIIDSHLNITKTVELPMRLSMPWLYDYDGDGNLDVYTVTYDGTIRIYNQELTLLAVSDPSSLIAWVTTLPNYDTYDDVYVFQTKRGDEVYSHDFKKIAALGSHDYYAPFEFDNRGRMRTFIAGGPQLELIARVVKRSWVHLVSVFYQDYQIWVLSVLFSLAVGLIVMNLYRSRVSRQRQALAAANSELAATHEALKQAQATIIAQEKYKQAKDMAGAFAHEIRNALFPADSALTKLVQLSGQPTADPDRIRSLRETIKTSVGRAVSITEEISTYTKLDSLFAPERVSVSALAEDLLRSHSVMLEENNLKFETDHSPACTVRANRAQMGVVLSNLFLNSIHALQDRRNGRISMDWKLIGRQIEIQFSDNGCGIPSDHLGRIFDAFFSTKSSKGTGLGLATCKRLVEMYGGSISVQSSVGTGTTFSILLPDGETVIEPNSASPSDQRSRHAES